MPEGLVDIIRDDRRVRSMLGIFGLLKFAEIPMIRSAGLLLNRLVSFWEPDSLAFRVQGERVDLTLADVYFLTGLPCLGRVADTQPRGTADLDIVDMAVRFCGAEAQVHRNALRVGDLQEPVVRATAACIVWILGSQAP